ncbi:MAG: HEAT repeat domain-containing protein [Pirellulales bacterium]|nr:HEAT repeat domain-containing protein [Pirellulales bacterium]
MTVSSRPSLRHKAARRATIVVIALALSVPGCRPWSGRMAEVLRPGGIETPSSAEIAADAPPASLSDLEFLLAKPDGWSLATASGEPSQGGTPWRWRLAGMDELLAAGQVDRGVLRQALASKETIVAGNAAIVLARLGDPSGQDKLIAAIQSLQFNMPMRRAAAEALGSLDAKPAVEAARTLIDRHGVWTGPNRGGYRPDLHAELLRGLARHVDPADDPRFETALHSPSADVRREAVVAWAGGRRGALPETAADLSADPDPRVRAAAMEAIRVRRHPKALAYLADGTRDMNLHVRLAAIEGLGQTGGAEAIDVLKRVLKERSETLRAAAVRALGAAGADEPVLGAAGDEAWQVRAAVAEALSRHPDPQGRKLARQLLDDRGPQVQLGVLIATDAWPLAEAGPILFAALEKDALQTRNAAAERLAARWPPGASFPHRGPPERRAESVAQLRAAFEQEFGAEGGTASVRPRQVVSPDAVAGAARLVAELADPRLASADRQRAADALGAMGPTLSEALAVLAIDHQQPLPETVFVEILPQCEPAFQALVQLRSPDVDERRRAARRILAQAEERPLGRLALWRLADQMAAESDSLVWQSVMTATASDASPPAVRLAQMAIGHASSEVRRRACEYLLAHPSPSHVPVLLPALEDPDQGIVRAAVAGLVAAGHLDDTAPLFDLLARADESTRVDAAAALARFGDDRGVEELLRLARHRDATVRQRAAEAMGHLADRRFVPVLIELLDDHLSIRRVALAALPKAAGHPAPHPPARPPANATEEATLWKQWFAQEHVGIGNRQAARP